LGIQEAVFLPVVPLRGLIGSDEVEKGKMKVDLGALLEVAVEMVFMVVDQSDLGGVA
jgi:hypothetical protein